MNQDTDDLCAFDSGTWSQLRHSCASVFSLCGATNLLDLTVPRKLRQSVV